LNPFTFTASPGATGTFLLDILVPDNEEVTGNQFSITGFATGTASLFSSTPWSSGQLDSYLGIKASPTNPIGAYSLPSGATGFDVYQVDLGSLALPANGSSVSASETFDISGRPPIGSYLIGFLDVSGSYGATANSGASS
jgi:hypothetical protein